MYDYNLVNPLILRILVEVEAEVEAEAEVEDKIEVLDANSANSKIL